MLLVVQVAVGRNNFQGQTTTSIPSMPVADVEKKSFFFGILSLFPFSLHNTAVGRRKIEARLNNLVLREVLFFVTDFGVFSV